jgi:hypothetical protein
VTLVVVALSGCGGVGQPAPYDPQGVDRLIIPTPTPDPDDFMAGIDNVWLPLTPGSTWTYDVTDDGATIGSTESEVLAESGDIAGVPTTAVRTATQIDGERTTYTRFYAQDADGNVWWLGEDGDVTWRAGEGGAEAGLAMPAEPRLGDGWQPYLVPGRPDADVMVEDQSSDMVQTRETGWEEADTTTLNFYTSGVGLVTVEDLDSGWTTELVDHQPG